jgi:hypothetical protein
MAMGEKARALAGLALAGLAIGACRPAFAANPDAAPASPTEDASDEDDLFGKWSPWQKCASPASTLTIEASGYAMHDDDTSQGRVRLHTKGGKDVGGYLGGTIGCLAYAQPTGKYVLGQVGGLAAWRPLLSLLYLDETTGKLTASRAPPAAIDENAWFALSAVASPDGRFIALVAGFGGRIGLSVLDTTRDCMVRIGRPPLPPPTKWARENVGKRAEFTWGEAAAGTDGFAGLDPGILVWRGSVLEASYGKDSPKARARLRSKKRWNLDELAAKCTVGQPVVSLGKQAASPEPEIEFAPKPYQPSHERRRRLDVFDLDISNEPPRPPAVR